MNIRLLNEWTNYLGGIFIISIPFIWEFNSIFLTILAEVIGFLFILKGLTYFWEKDKVAHKSEPKVDKK